MSALRNYTRWRGDGKGGLIADILGADILIEADPDLGMVLATFPGTLTPDEARLIGVRLIEGAALADGNRAVREASA